MGCAPEGTGYHAVRLPGEVRNAGFSLRINGKKAVLMPEAAPKDNPSGVEKERASFAIAPRGNLSYIGAGVMAIMAFCSTCGANMTGAFCAKCGTPAGVAQARAPMAPVGAPVARRTSPIVWVLVVILGLFVLCGLGAAGIGFLVLHRARQAGVSFDRTREGGFAIRGRDGSVEFGTAGKLPSWIPSYPGSRPAFAVRAQGSGSDWHAGSEGGEFTFTTPDAASQVLAFYERKCKDMAMNVNISTSNGEGGTVVAADEGDQRSLTIVATGRVGHTTVIVTYGRK